MKRHAIYLFISTILFAQAVPEWRTWAPTPPMGWNSYDAYYGCIIESQFRDIVDVLSDKYLPYGYEYAVIDYCWFNPGPDGWDPDNWTPFHIDQAWHEDGSYHPILTMDEYGRFTPSVNRFPSASDGRGFKRIADYVHSRGMKFGIHIIRGIPRQAVAENLPVKGTPYRARDIIYDVPVSWTMNTHRIDITKPGAQEYYDSIFELYAEWGVDFVKADNTMKPFYRAGEIQMMHEAILKCGRPIVLSQSWGEPPLSYAKHLNNTSNMWRISGDFWDTWSDVRDLFDLCSIWSPFIGEGTWPDADMLPIGLLCKGGFPNPSKPFPEHFTRLSHDEIISMMSLWCIARSPLMWGGDPLTTPESYDEYLINKEVLAVNQNSTNNREILRNREERVWMADIPESDDVYLSLFNMSEEKREVRFEFFWDKIHNQIWKVRDLWMHEELGAFELEFKKELPAHGAGLYRMTPIQN